jgi:hypothetical protein
VSHLIEVRRGSENKLWWISFEKGLFKVKSFFFSLACFEGTCFPWKSVWQTQSPSRAAFFAWLAGLERTFANLRKRHVVVINRCCMCKKTRESMDLLLHCNVAFALRSALFNRFEMSWVMPRRH